MSRAAVLSVVVSCLAAVPNTSGLSLKYAPTTTVTAETANNTSTADSFLTSSNGNLGAGNVSKLPIKSLLYAGANTKVIAATMGWWGKSSHINIGYRSDDPAQVKRQLEDMQSRGMDGLTLAWYGSGSTELSNLSAQAIMRQAEQMSGFTFALRPNEGIIKWFSNGMTPTDALVYHLKYAAQTYFDSPAYMRVNGRPVLLFFGFESYAIDWSVVRASLPGNPLFIFRNANGFTHSESDGGFAWGPANQLSYLDWYYQHAVPYQDTKINYGNGYKGFDDSLASWTARRVIGQQCGQTWLASMAYAGKFYSPNKELQFIQISTWNDYEEGTAIETGIDNCLSVTTSISGSTLQWNLTGTGQENTIDHYTVFVSQDGEKLMPIAEVATGNYSLELGSYGLPPATYQVFVKAIGKASFRNQFSGGVTYAVANQPPQAALSVSTTSTTVGAPVVFSSAASSDVDGTIASSRVDFGDGSGATGTEVTHSYSAAGTYTATLTVTDDQNASSTATATISVVKALGVTLLSPAPGATVGSPVAIRATSSSAYAISSMSVFVDGVMAYSNSGSGVNISLVMSPGSHTIVVKCVDIGGQSSASATITVPNLAPIAKVSLSATSGIGPLMVTASGNGSSDPDGKISATTINFGDGYTASGASASHTYATPGTYTVTVTVKDDLGMANSASAAVKVNAGVLLLSPSSSVATSFRTVASAFSSKPISSMAVYVDGVQKYTVSGNRVDTYVRTSTGTHLLEVKSWNSAGTMYKTSRTIIAK